MIIKVFKSIIKYRFIVFCFIFGILLGRFTAYYIVDVIMDGDISEIGEGKDESVIITEEIVEESISFYIERKEDPTLELGTEIIVQEGVEGLKNVTYEITLTDGVETDRNIISSEITKNPINKIVRVGTKELEENLGEE